MNYTDFLSHGSILDPFWIIIKCIILILFFPFFIVWIYVFIADMISKDNERFTFNHYLNFLKGILVAMFLLLVFFSIEIYITGISKYSWSLFPFDISNIYLQLLPEILCYMGLIIIFIISNKKLLNTQKI